MHIDPSHPRATSLAIREKLVTGVKKGLTSPAGLLAHGRGEAFDYLLGEKTHPFARRAINTAAAYLLLASYPVLSINGNTAALEARKFIKLARLLKCKIEVNLFHYSQKRAALIENHLARFDKDLILSSKKHQSTIIPKIASDRKKVLKRGIGNADLVFVPLEDGDRTRALILLGKKVIAVDLNPLSRTAKAASVTIVDNIVRCLPKLIKVIAVYKKLSREKLQKIVNRYDNQKILSQAINSINHHLHTQAEKWYDNKR